VCKLGVCTSQHRICTYMYTYIYIYMYVWPQPYVLNSAPMTRSRQHPTSVVECCGVLQRGAFNNLRASSLFENSVQFLQIDLYSSIYAHTKGTQNSFTHTCTQNILYVHIYRYTFTPRMWSWWSDQTNSTDRKLLVKLNMHVSSPFDCCPMPVTNGANSMSLFCRIMSHRIMSHLKQHDLEKAFMSGRIVGGACGRFCFSFSFFLCLSYVPFLTGNSWAGYVGLRGVDSRSKHLINWRRTWEPTQLKEDASSYYSILGKVWVFFERTRILGGIYFQSISESSIMIHVCRNKTILRSNRNMICTLQTCGQRRSSKAAGSKGVKAEGIPRVCQGASLYSSIPGNRN